VLLGLPARDRVIADGLARPHPYEPHNGWVTSPAGDREAIVALFRLALNERR
jgi:Luciferase